MYNHLTNGWKGEHLMVMDPRHEETRKAMIRFLDKWLASHPAVDWVRLTSLAYCFPIISNEENKPKIQDWAAYLDCTSVKALDEFEKQKGYRLPPEVLVDSGYYNSLDRIPSKEYLDWMDFVHKFVVGFGKECVASIHKSGKKAIMFYCDHWIGTEPYSPSFKEMGMDGIVGPCMSGGELRRITGVEGNLIKEVRLYPYFFPLNLKNEPSFAEGGNPVRECVEYWMNVKMCHTPKMRGPYRVRWIS